MSQRPSLAQHMGELVWDGESRRIGVLMDVRTEVGGSRLGDPPPSDVLLLAFLRPEHGGREWTVPLESVSVLERSTRAEEGQSARCADGSRSPGTCLPLAEDDRNGGTVTETAETAEIAEAAVVAEIVETAETAEAAEAAESGEAAEVADFGAAESDAAESEAAETPESEEGGENRGGVR